MSATVGVGFPENLQAALRVVQANLRVYIKTFFVSYYVQVSRYNTNYELHEHTGEYHK